MSNYLKASKLFNTTFDTNQYFESLNAEYTKNSLIKAIESGSVPLLFLLGEPGVGKTYMINILKASCLPTKKVLYSSEPFLTPESFLYFLLEDSVANVNVSELKSMAVSKYKDIDNLIIIDEAQLLDDKVLEYIRILADTKHFNFLLSMHKVDGEKIVKKKHFLSRDHRVVTLGVLQENEIKRYIESQLLRNGIGDISEMFKKKQIKILSKFSNGNFRMLKQLLKHTFSIMDYAKTHGNSKYVVPNECVLTMAAIDLGILDA